MFRVFDIESMFARSQPEVRGIFDRLLAIAKEHGTVRVILQKSRMALQVRMRFAALMPQKAR